MLHHSFFAHLLQVTWVPRAQMWLMVRVFAVIALILLPALPLGATSALDHLIPESKPKHIDLVDVGALEKLIHALENKGTRKEMIDQMRTLIAVKKNEAIVEKGPFGVGKISDLIHAASGKILDFLYEIEGLWRRIQNALSHPDTRSFFLAALGYMGMIVGAGYGTKILLKSCYLWLYTRPRHGRSRLEKGDARSNALTLPRHLFIADMGSLIAMAVVMEGIPLFCPVPFRVDPLLSLATSIVLWYEVFMTMVRGVFSQTRIAFRLFTFSDGAARNIYAYFRALGVIFACGLGGSQYLVYWGVSTLIYGFAIKVTLLISAYSTLRFIFRVKESVSTYLQSLSAAGPVTPLKKGQKTGADKAHMLYDRIAHTWHLWASLYVFVFVGMIVFQTIYDLRSIALSFMGTAFLVMTAYVLFLRVPNFAARLVGDLEASFPYLTFRGSFYRALISITISLSIIVGLSYVTLDLWGVGLLDGFFDHDDGDVSSRFLNLLLLGIAGLLLWEAQEYIVYRFFHAGAVLHKNSAKHRRLTTLKPLVHNISRTFAFSVLALILFAELRLDVTPLLAGLGVVGIAFSFGSQSLVKDFITGVFILAEDTMNVGDIVQINEQKGTVETLSLRTVRFRDVEGNLHTIPYSSIDKVTNLSKSFAYYMIDVSLAYHQDLDRALSVMAEAGAALQADPSYAPYILEPLEILGVDRLTRFGIVVLARIKTVADRNRWVVGRKFNRLLAERFAQEEIAFFEEYAVLKTPPSAVGIPKS